MYVIYCLLIWCFVYFIPALACAPWLILSPRTFFAVPLLSATIIYGLASILIVLGYFSSNVVMLLSLLLLATAAMRVRHLLASERFTWSGTAYLHYIFNSALLFPFFIKLATHAFDRGDELYSWNFWAIQHYFQESLDDTHTGAPYPQLLPKLLAYCYHLLNNLELQLPIKGGLIFFPWAMLNAIAMSVPNRLSSSLANYWLLAGVILFGIGLAQFFNDGYADPIMASLLVGSAALLWQSQHLRAPYENLKWQLRLAVLLGVAAAHAKQPGLLWAMFSMPCLLLWLYQRQANKELLVLACLSFLGGLSWVLGEGQHFHHNTGVIGLSLADRDFISQLGFAINRYFVHHPLLFVLFFVAGVVAWRQMLLRLMVFLFALPSLLLWFLFGAYQLRLGQHLIGFAFFLIAASGYQPFGVFAFWHNLIAWCRLRQRSLVVSAIGLSLSLTICTFFYETTLKQPDIHLTQGIRTSLRYYFKQDAERVYNQFFKGQYYRIWVPSRYLYGLFYKHAELIVPAYNDYPIYNQTALLTELQHTLPDYVFTADRQYADGEASSQLKLLVDACPAAFSRVLTPKTKFGITTYKVNKDLLQGDPCLMALKA